MERRKRRREEEVGEGMPDLYVGVRNLKDRVGFPHVPGVPLVDALSLSRSLALSLPFSPSHNPDRSDTF